MNGLCVLCVRPIPNRANGKTDTKTERGGEEYNKNVLFNTAAFTLMNRDQA
jgi:hypothetical protein